MECGVRSVSRVGCGGVCGVWSVECGVQCVE